MPRSWQSGLLAPYEEGLEVLIQNPAILISDDDFGFRETLRGVFEPEGFRTYLAGDGEEALEIVHKQEIHLLLLDMHMPKLTGLEVVRLVKQFKAVLPCIILSANADETLVQQARLAEAFTVLAKPVTRQSITGTVAQALQRTYNWPQRGRSSAGSH
jgi:CheY-like chemotaxis protein